MARNTLKFVAVFAAAWVFILFYVGSTLSNLSEDTSKSAAEIARISKELELLKISHTQLRNERGLDVKSSNNNNNNNNNQNAGLADRVDMVVKLGNAQAKIKELQTKISQLEKQLQQQQQKQDVQQKQQNHDDVTSISTGHSPNYDKLSRRVGNQIREMWFLVSASVSKVIQSGADNNGALKNLVDNFGEIQRITEHDFEELMMMNGQQKIRDETAENLSKLIQQRLHKLQNPKDCKTARKLVCTLNKGCGYGCQAHHVLYCFLAAYATKRTLIIDSTGWRYSQKGWKQYFAPASDSCVHFDHPIDWNSEHEKAQVVHFPIVDSLYPRPKQMPQNVPREFYDQISSFHGHPFLWWIGQFSKYLFRISPQMKEVIDKRKSDMNFKGPIVGIQVRRTDKINVEAAYHDIDEYMHWVHLYYKKLELTQTVDKKRVFIATDDSTVLDDAKKKYPDYEFLSDTSVAKSAGLQHRYSELSLRGVVSDIELLSETDYLVCTFSSQVCRMAYEIMNGKHTDASRRFHSLDDIYYFGGQEEHRMRAIWPHKAKTKQEFDFHVGDIIGIAGNHWDGHSKGLHHNSHRDGLYPSFKVEDVHDVCDFPSYDDYAN